MEAGHYGVSKGGSIDIAAGHPSGQQANPHFSPSVATTPLVVCGLAH
jgi:hypothetical protein